MTTLMMFHRDGGPDMEVSGDGQKIHFTLLRGNTTEVIAWVSLTHDECQRMCKGLLRVTGHLRVREVEEFVEP